MTNNMTDEEVADALSRPLNSPLSPEAIRPALNELRDFMAEERQARRLESHTLPIVRFYPTSAKNCWRCNHDEIDSDKRCAAASCRAAQNQTLKLGQVVRLFGALIGSPKMAVYGYEVEEEAPFVPKQVICVWFAQDRFMIETFAPELLTPFIP